MTPTGTAANRTPGAPSRKRKKLRLLPTRDTAPGPTTHVGRSSGPSAFTFRIQGDQARRRGAPNPSCAPAAPPPAVSSRSGRPAGPWCIPRRPPRPRRQVGRPRGWATFVARSFRTVAKTTGEANMGLPGLWPLTGHTQPDSAFTPLSVPVLASDPAGRDRAPASHRPGCRTRPAHGEVAHEQAVWPRLGEARRPEGRTSPGPNGKGRCRPR